MAYCYSCFWHGILFWSKWNLLLWTGKRFTFTFTFISLYFYISILFKKKEVWLDKMFCIVTTECIPIFKLKTLHPSEVDKESTNWVQWEVKSSSLHSSLPCFVVSLTRNGQISLISHAVLNLLKMLDWMWFKALSVINWEDYWLSEPL